MNDGQFITFIIVMALLIVIEAMTLVELRELNEHMTLIRTLVR